MINTPHPALGRIQTAGISSKFSTGSSPTSSSRRRPPPSPTHYRVEERTRTIYVQSEVHPSLWKPETMEKIFDLAAIPESAPAPEHVSRSRSMTEKKIFVFPDKTGPDGRPCPPSPQKENSAPYRRHPSRSESSILTTHTNDRNGADPKRSPVFKRRQKILFYHKHDPYYGFTNFSSHPVLYKGKTYPTSEHLFQSFKFQGHRPNLAEHIRTCSDRPSVAFSEARRFQPEVRKDWSQVNIEKMEETLFFKFTQHADLLQELLATGDAELVEDSDKDSFWGIGADGKGRNELGKALERLRAQLRGSD